MNAYMGVICIAVGLGIAVIHQATRDASVERNFQNCLQAMPQPATLGVLRECREAAQSLKG